MLYFLFVWTILIISCGWIGLTWLNLTQTKAFPRLGDRAMVSIWLGIVLLAIALLAISLILPLSPGVGIAAIVGLGLPGLFWGKNSQEIREIISIRLHKQRISKTGETPIPQEIWSRSIISPFFGAIGLAIAFFVAAITTRQVTWIDTGLYHYGSVRWLSEFGTVTGIALLFPNLGFTSSWFALAAPFNPEFLDTRASAVMNGFVFAIASLHFLVCLTQSLNPKIEAKKIKISDAFIMVSFGITLPLVATNNLMKVILVSPSPDIPVLLLILVVAWAILVISNQTPEDLTLGSNIIPPILAAGAMTMKPTALPLLLICGCFYLVRTRFNLGKFFMGVGLVTILLIPMLNYGIVTSGCPLFPSYALCLNLPWTPTAESLKSVADSTHEWTTWYATGESEETSWLSLFWQWMNAGRLNQVTVVLIAIAILSSIYLLLKLKSSQLKGQLWLIAITVTGMIFLLLTAPFFKFALGYLTVAIALAIAIFLEPFDRMLERLNSWINLRQTKRVTSVFLATLIGIILLGKTLQNELFLPPQLPQVELVRKRVNNVIYFSPKNPGQLCWGSELPCGFIIENVKLRAPEQGIRGGFVREK